MMAEANPNTNTEFGTTSEGVRQNTNAVKEDLLGLGRATMDAAKDRLADGKQIASDTGDQIVGYIRRNPLKSVLITTGVGVLAGFLLSRR